MLSALGLPGLIGAAACSAFMVAYGGFFLNAVGRAAQQNACVRIRYTKGGFVEVPVPGKGDVPIVLLPVITGFYVDNSGFCKDEG
ncbi:hypothetical protein ACWIGW_16350 [Nocardia brasiliensis]